MKTAFRELSFLKTGFVLAVALTGAACTGMLPEKDAQEPMATRQVSSVAEILEPEPPCLGMVKSFCDMLYAPQNQGHLQFQASGQIYEIKLGKTSNDFRQPDYEFLKAKLLSRMKLPRDLRTALESHDYFDRVKKYLNHSFKDKMNLAERTKIMRMEEEIDSIWRLALKETVLSRMEKSFPGFSSIVEDLVPMELRFEAQRQKRLLTADVANAIWRNHPNWKRVEKEFKRVQDVYKDVLRKGIGIDNDTQKDWLDRLASVKLLLPGTDPELDMDQCLKDEENAYYFAEKNALTVCAGDFNSEDITQTLAHEMSHSLDLSRSRLLFQSQSTVGKKLEALKKSSCSAKNTLSCTEWQAFKTGLPALLGEYANYKPQLQQLNACLKDKETKKEMPDEYAQREAGDEVNDTLADLAERGIFLRIISPRLPLPDGTFQRNPLYMNPCGYYLWDSEAHSLQEDVSFLLFFAAEYKCSNEKSRDKKFELSMETARDVERRLILSKIKMEGEFSDRPRLITDGYSEPPDERFADYMGQIVFSEILKDEKDSRRRRAVYLANNAWVCRKPSVQQLMPLEARIQKRFYVEPHSDLGVRQRELLSSGIRESLSCKLDFDQKECSINPVKFSSKWPH